MSEDSIRVTEDAGGVLEPNAWNIRCWHGTSTTQMCENGFTRTHWVDPYQFIQMRSTYQETTRYCLTVAGTSGRIPIEMRPRESRTFDRATHSAIRSGMGNRQC